MVLSSLNFLSTVVVRAGIVTGDTLREPSLLAIKSEEGNKATSSHWPRLDTRDKFNIDFNLEWNITEFKLLGIMFSVDLHKIPNLNFEPLLGKVKCILSTWKKRHLTPLGKITVLNIFI